MKSRSRIVRARRSVSASVCWPTEVFRERQTYPQASPQRCLAQCKPSSPPLLLVDDVLEIVFDSLLPRSAIDHAPLHATSYNSNSSLVSESHPSASASKECLIGPPWLPLAIKGYYKALGGYSIRGGNPAPDIYAFTGWIPERLSLTEGLQREKVWRRVREAWERGEILITLGTGERASGRFVNLHAYAVLGQSPLLSGTSTLTVYPRRNG